MRSNHMNTVKTLLSKYVSVPSIYPKEKKMGDVVKADLEAMGFSVETETVEQGRMNLYATRGSDPKILFYAHLDTVPLVSEQEWQSDPFELTEKGDEWVGLGAYDMKGGLSAMMAAFSKTDAPVKVFCAVDEENISKGAWKAYETHGSFFEGVKLIISAEPNFGLGLNGITTERTGRFLFTYTAQGKPAHVAEYQKGVDAIEMVSRAITRLYEKRDALYKEKNIVVQVRKVNGEAVGMSVPGVASCEIEALTPQGVTTESLCQLLSTIMDGAVMVKPRETPYLPGYAFSAFPYKETIAAIIKKQTKKTMKLHSRHSVGDDNVLATLGIPVITWGPDGQNAHKPNETVLQSSLVTLSSMFTEFLRSC